jgi:hypothetical protein
MKLKKRPGPTGAVEPVKKKEEINNVNCAFASEENALKTLVIRQCKPFAITSMYECGFSNYASVCDFLFNPGAETPLLALSSRRQGLDTLSTYSFMQQGNKKERI